MPKAWANIDVLLRQRHDELPKLVETCKQYMKFEQDTLTRVMEARAKVFSAREAQNIPQLGQAGVHLLRKPRDGRLFPLANEMPDRLGSRYRFWSWVHLVTFLGAGSTGLLML